MASSPSFPLAASALLFLFLASAALLATAVSDYDSFLSSAHGHSHGEGGDGGSFFGHSHAGGGGGDHGHADTKYTFNVGSSSGGKPSSTSPPKSKSPKASAATSVRQYAPSRGKYQRPVETRCKTDVAPGLLRRVESRLIYLSWEDKRYHGGDRAETWNGARTFCRRNCMDLVTVDEARLNKYLVEHARKGDVYGLWTSGRFCPAANCTYNSENVLYHWRWTSDERGDHKAVGDHWSRYGGLGRRQPDNLLETLGLGDREECLALLNNWYGDGVAWHDMGCAERLAFACEKPTNGGGGGNKKSYGGGGVKNRRRPRPSSLPPSTTLKHRGRFGRFRH